MSGSLLESARSALEEIEALEVLAVDTLGQKPSGAKASMEQQGTLKNVVEGMTAADMPAPSTTKKTMKRTSTTTATPVTKKSKRDDNDKEWEGDASDSADSADTLKMGASKGT